MPRVFESGLASPRRAETAPKDFPGIAPREPSRSTLRILRSGLAALILCAYFARMTDSGPPSDPRRMRPGPTLPGRYPQVIVRRISYFIPLILLCLVLAPLVAAGPSFDRHRRPEELTAALQDLAPG